MQRVALGVAVLTLAGMGYGELSYLSLIHI